MSVIDDLIPLLKKLKLSGGCDGQALNTPEHSKTSTFSSTPECQKRRCSTWRRAPLSRENRMLSARPDRRRKIPHRPSLGTSRLSSWSQDALHECRLDAEAAACSSLRSNLLHDA